MASLCGFDIPVENARPRTKAEMAALTACSTAWRITDPLMSTTCFARVRPAAERLVAEAASVSRAAADRAGELDHDYAVPEADITALHHAGLLLAPFPFHLGGDGVAAGAAARGTLPSVLRRIGAGSLSLGRLYEGHVNAAGLIMRYGRPDQISAMAKYAGGGALFGVWNTDDDEGLRLVVSGSQWRLQGRKILCSGAGFIERPIVTARDDADRVLMIMPRLNRDERADLSAWTPQGMRASATGSVDFTDIVVRPRQILGGAGDYQRQPAFSGGAWRFAAVQQGAMEALLDLLRGHFVSTKRGGDPHQSARLGKAAIAVETARLWVERASQIAEVEAHDAEAVIAYVNLTRLAVERAALDLLELVHRSVGLVSFVRPNPIERISRDLATYLRQPAPDRALTEAAGWMLTQPEDVAKLWA